MSSDQIHKSSPYTKVTPDDFSPATVFAAHNSPNNEELRTNGNVNEVLSAVSSNRSLYTALEDPWQVYRDKNHVNRERPTINYNNNKIRYSNHRPLFAQNKILAKKLKQKKLKNKFRLHNKRKKKSVNQGNHYSNIDTEVSHESNSTNELYERIMNVNPNFQTKDDLYSKLDSLNQHNTFQNLLPNEILKFSFSEYQDHLDGYYGYQHVPPKENGVKIHTRKFKSNLNNKRKGKFIKRFWKKLFTFKKKKKQNQNAIKKIRQGDIQLHKVDSATANLIDQKFTSFIDIQRNPNNHLNDNSSNVSVKIITNGVMADLDDIAPPTSPTSRKRMFTAKNKLLLQLMKFNPSIRSQIVYPELESVGQDELVLKNDMCTNAFERFEFEDGINYGVLTKANKESPQSNELHNKVIHQSMPDAEFDELVNNKNASPLKKSDIERSNTTTTDTTISERTNSSDTDNAHEHHHDENSQALKKNKKKKKKNYIDFSTPPLSHDDFVFLINNDEGDKRISVATVTPADEIAVNNGSSEAKSISEGKSEVAPAATDISKNVANANNDNSSNKDTARSAITKELKNPLADSHFITSPPQTIFTHTDSVVSSKDSLVINSIPVGLATRYDNKRHSSISHARKNPNKNNRMSMSRRTSIFLGSLGIGNNSHTNVATGANSNRSSKKPASKKNKKKVTIDEQLLITENMVTVDPSFIPRATSNSSISKNLRKRTIKSKDSHSTNSSATHDVSISSKNNNLNRNISSPSNNNFVATNAAVGVTSAAAGAVATSAAATSIDSTNRSLSNASSRYSNSKASYIQKNKKGGEFVVHEEGAYNNAIDYGKMYVETGILLSGGKPQVVFTSSGEEQETNDYVDEFGNVKSATKVPESPSSATNESVMGIIKTETVSNDDEDYKDHVEIHPVGETYSLKNSLLSDDDGNGVGSIHEEFMPDAEEILGKIQNDAHVEFERRRSSIDSYVTANTALEQGSEQDIINNLNEDGINAVSENTFNSRFVGGAVGGDIFKISEVEQRALQRELDSFDATSLQRRIQEKLAKENESFSSFNSGNSNDSMAKYYSSDVLAENSVLFKSRMKYNQGNTSNNKAATQYINQGKKHTRVMHGFGAGATTDLSGGVPQRSINSHDEMFYKRRTLIDSGNSSDDLKDHGSGNEEEADEEIGDENRISDGKDQKFAVYGKKIKGEAGQHTAETEENVLRAAGVDFMSSSSSSNGGTSRSNSVHPASHVGSSSRGSGSDRHSDGNDEDGSRPEEVEAWMSYMRRILNERIRQNLLLVGNQVDPTVEEGGEVEQKEQQRSPADSSSKKGSPHSVSSSNSGNRGSDKLLQRGGQWSHSREGSNYSMDSRHQQKYSGFIEYYSNKKEGASVSGRTYSIRSKISTGSSGSSSYHEIMVSMDNGFGRGLGTVHVGGSGSSVVSGNSSGHRRRGRVARS